VLEGAGFVPAFESIEQRRLVAVLLPYLVLPIGAAFSLLLFWKGRYRAAAALPIVVTAGVFIAGRLYLMVVPDPIVENFGVRPQPYSGFLILPFERIPDGFGEVSHHYTKSEYTIRYRKALNNGGHVDLDIAEGPITQFVVNETELVRRFDYQAITARVYASNNTKRGETTLNLVWLNPPRQRIAIYLTQPEGSGYSPEDLIRVLESMQPAK